MHGPAGGAGGPRSPRLRVRGLPVRLDVVVDTFLPATCRSPPAAAEGASQMGEFWLLISHSTEKLEQTDQSQERWSSAW